jgi:hypothetical protein
MPRIQDYNLQTSAPGVAEQTRANVEDTGNVGTALRNAGSEVENAGVLLDRRAGQADVANQAAHLSNTRAGLTEELQTRVQNASPDDITGINPDGSPGRSMTEKYSDYVDEQFDRMPEPTTRAGREFAQRQRAALKQHLVDSMSRQQGALAGVNAVRTVQTTTNTNANSLEQDPQGFKLAVEAHDAYVDSMVATGGLPASRAAELKQWGHQQLAEGAARGYVHADPETGKQLVESGMFDSQLTRPQKDALLQYADSQIKAKDVDARRQTRELKEAAQEVVNTRMAHYTQSLYTPGAKPEPLSKVLNDPAFKNNPTAMREMISIYDRHNNDALKGNPARFTQLLSQIHDPNNPHPVTQQQLFGEVGNGGLSIQQRNLLSKEIDKTPEGQAGKALKAGFMSEAKGVIIGKDAIGMVDPNGPARMRDFQVEALQAIQKGTEQGKTMPQLLSPTLNGKPNPDYIGGMIDKYRQTPGQRMQAIAAARRGAPGAPAAAPAPAAPPPGSVRVRSPDGREGVYKGTPPPGWTVIK